MSRPNSSATARRLPRSPARPLALLGFMGAGKSTVGLLVAKSAKLPFADLDAMIEDSAGKTVVQIFEREGEPSFRDWESRQLIRALAGPGVVALGGGAPLDAANWELVRSHAISVWIDTPFDVIWERVAGSDSRPLLRGSGREQVRALFESRRWRYGEADHRVDGAAAPDQIAAEVLRLWKG